ncbi:MAG: sugar epimerase [Nonlabens sp.]
MNIPTIIKGSVHQDQRGSLFYNNDFEMSDIKRMYVISNTSLNFYRGWQGHKIESRWFQPIIGKYQIFVVGIESELQTDPESYSFEIDANNSETLYVPKGHATCIKTMTEMNKLAVFSDYAMGAINDEHRFEVGHFNLIMMNS